MNRTGTRIDFIAHHRIQMQCLDPIFSELSARYHCEKLMGPNIEPTGASVGIVTDHLAYQPSVTRDNYQYLIHIAHDLSDVEVYRKEKEALSKFSLILVPSEIHKLQVQKYIPHVPCSIVGWTKMPSTIDKHKLGEHIVFPSKVGGTALVAWTDISNTNWKDFLVAASQSNMNFIIKNHVYYERDLGIAPPPNQFKEYSSYISQLDYINEYLLRNRFENIVLVDASENLINLFPYADVLITDYSSAALEFANYGISVETGKPILPFFMRRLTGKNFTRRAASNLAGEIRYLRESLLIESLPKMEISDFLNLPMNASSKYSVNSFFPTLKESPGTTASNEIRNLIGALD
jgi:hypothetical protein